MTTSTVVLLGIFLMLGLLFGLACFFVGPAGWVFWIISMAFLAGCGIFYGLWRLLGFWVIGIPGLGLALGLLLFWLCRIEAVGTAAGPGLFFITAVIVIGLKILCPPRQP